MSRPEYFDSTSYDDEYDKIALTKALNRPEVYEDEHGYEVALCTGAIHPQHGWVAWVDYYEKKNPPPSWIDCNYYLRIKYDEKILVEWIIETYNPAFGCYVGYFNWHDDKIIIIYTEKHNVYGATVDKTGLVKRLELGCLGTEYCVGANGAIIYPLIDHDLPRHKYPCYKIPSWESLPPMSEDEAIKLGILRRQ